MAVGRSTTCKSLDLGIKMVEQQYHASRTMDLDNEIEDPSQEFMMDCCLY